MRAIIRPPRALYAVSHLGSATFRLENGVKYRRRDFVIPSTDGVLLAASQWEHFEYTDKELPCVVYLHGNSSCRAAAAEALRPVLLSGATLLAIDFGGCGHSTGEYVTLGHNEQDDIEAVVKYLRNRGRVSMEQESITNAPATTNDRNNGSISVSSTSSADSIEKQLTRRGDDLRSESGDGVSTIATPTVTSTADLRLQQQHQPQQQQPTAELSSSPTPHLQPLRVPPNLVKDIKTGPIILWGRSMGAVASLLYAAKDPSIAALVLDSPFADLKQLCLELASSVLASGGIRIPVFMINTVLSMVRSSVKKRTGLDLYTFRPVDIAPSVYMPALIAVGSEDNFVSPHHARACAENYGGDHQFFLIPGADHNSERPDEWSARVTAFISAAIHAPVATSTPRAHGAPSTAETSGRTTTTSVVSHSVESVTSYSSQSSHEDFRVVSGQIETTVSVSTANKLGEWIEVSTEEAGSAAAPHAAPSLPPPPAPVQAVSTDDACTSQTSARESPSAAESSNGGGWSIWRSMRDAILSIPALNVPMSTDNRPLTSLTVDASTGSTSSVDVDSNILASDVNTHMATVTNAQPPHSIPSDTAQFSPISSSPAIVAGSHPTNMTGAETWESMPPSSSSSSTSSITNGHGSHSSPRGKVPTVYVVPSIHVTRNPTVQPPVVPPQTGVRPASHATSNATISDAPTSIALESKSEVDLSSELDRAQATEGTTAVTVDSVVKAVSNSAKDAFTSTVDPPSLVIDSPSNSEINAIDPPRSRESTGSSNSKVQSTDSTIVGEYTVKQRTRKDELKNVPQPALSPKVRVIPQASITLPSSLEAELAEATESPTAPPEMDSPPSALDSQSHTINPLSSAVGPP